MTAVIRSSNAPTNRGAGAYTLGAAATLVNPFFQNFDRRFSGVLTTDKTRLFFPIVIASPPVFDPSLADWTAVEDGQIFSGLWYSKQTLEEDLGTVPIIPILAWDEVDWNKDFHGSYAPQTMEQDLGAIPIIPSLAYDEDPSHSIESRQQQDEEPWHTFFLIPVAPPTLGWDDWDWSRDYSTVYVTSPEAEPFDFTVPVIPSFDWFDDMLQYSQVGISALVLLDEFVGVPIGQVGQISQIIWLT